jgi:predicted MFS family arabinose efflux permease
MNQRSVSSEERTGFDHLPPGYSPRIVGIIIYCLFFANLFFNIDMGILPAGSIKIKGELKMSNSQYGVLGSVVYFGQVVGSVLAAGILSFCSPKYVLASCVFLNIGFLLVFTVTDVFWILAASRTMTGLF